MMNVASHIRLVIFDVDGMLVTTKSGATFRKTADDWQWIPGRITALYQLYEQGVKLALATNQGGVAFGYMEEDAIGHEIAIMNSESGFDAIKVCCTHPNASIDRYCREDNRRKPGNGMLLEIQEELKIGPIHTLYVGDRPEDEQAAQNAGVAFMWADEFFGED